MHHKEIGPNNGILNIDKVKILTLFFIQLKQTQNTELIRKSVSRDWNSVFEVSSFHHGIVGLGCWGLVCYC